MLYTTEEQRTDRTSVWDANSTAYNKQTKEEGERALPKRGEVKRLYSHWSGVRRSSFWPLSQRSESEKIGATQGSCDNLVCLPRGRRASLDRLPPQVCGEFGRCTDISYCSVFCCVIDLLIALDALVPGCPSKGEFCAPVHPE
jgi:hypothetical protein